MESDSEGGTLATHDRAETDSLSMRNLETHNRADYDSPALDVIAALGVSPAVRRPMSASEGELATIEERLLRDINIVYCRRCLKGFSCSPSSDVQEVNEVTASAVIPLQSCCVVIIDSGATRQICCLSD